MASKITPLYAETRILLSLWSLGGHPSTKSKFVPKGKAYSVALDQLVESSALSTKKEGRYQRYLLTDKGNARLAEHLHDEAFGFSTSIGPKTTNAILSWFRQHCGDSRKPQQSDRNGQATRNGSVPAISSYQAFTQEAFDIYDRLNRDYNLDDLVPIYRLRREMGDRLSRQDFNEWLLQVQANDLIQLTGGELPNATADQLEDSVAIPGGSTRFYIRRLK